MSISDFQQSVEQIARRLKRKDLIKTINQYTKGISIEHFTQQKQNTHFSSVQIEHSLGYTIC